MAKLGLVLYREWLDLLSIDDFMWMPYNAASIMSVVPQEFIGAPHGDFFTFAMPLIFFRFIEVLPVDRVLRQFGGKQSPPRPPLNIVVFHKQSARNDDGWWPDRLAEWFEAWNNRRSDGRRLVIDPVVSLHPSRQYFEWYKERTRQFLCNPSRFYDPRAVDIPPQAPVRYGDSLAVTWPDVPQDRRQLATRVRRARQAEQEDAVGDDLPRQPPHDNPSPRRSPKYPDPQYYCPQPFEPTQPHPMFDFLHEASSYEIGSSSQTPADLGLSLSPFAIQGPPLQGRHSVSHLDTAGSAFRHYDPDVMQGRRLSFADDTPQEQPQGRPRRARRPPSCGTGGHLGHDGHEH
ncbi:hypothetical protein PIB30_034121 [Stylosanthes scabra]|uniref:Aminotransferase-like plant mobile domain-containing protein n=1 Tax=Stylosanthes scabra TaxID=79078 RepID=A0ABU6TEK9_9FABA|nr:hypothetical protein [Stylosanthes scabra]